MTPREIKAALMLNDVCQADIARNLGVSHMAVWMVINGRLVSTRIQKAIADAICRPAKEVWPQKTA